MSPPSFLEKYDETKGNPLLSRRVKGLSNSIDEILVEMQFDLLRKKAASGESFVIVGRCAEELFRGRSGWCPSLWWRTWRTG